MTNGAWDIRVEPVELEGLAIDAGQRIGMVIAQPQYELVPDGTVPFRISDPYRQAQGQLIQKAFEIRAAESIERSVPIPFIVFPEAAIPVRDPDGLDRLRQQMEQAQEDVVFIGGLEGLSPQEARDVADRLAPGVGVARPTFADGTFVNVCVIAVKSAHGQLSWYFQAKLRPSEREQRRNMARGQRVLHFGADRVAFLCQICFDHIAAQGEEPLNAVLCRRLAETVRPPNAARLDFVFVPQYNPKPDAMSERTSDLLNFEDRALKNDLAAIVVVNKAASVQESVQYGRSGFHYKEGRWRIPTNDVGPKGYSLCKSHRLTSAVFRKRTQAVHVATLVPASQNIGDLGNPRSPLDNPRSYLIGEGCDPTPCSDLPGTTCALGRFVECDCLPCKLRDVLLAALPATDSQGRWQAVDDTQSTNLTAHYREIRGHMLALDCARASELLDLLLHMYKDGKANPDTWAEPRPSAVVELLAALCVLREWHQPLLLETKKEWTALLGDFLAVVLVDGENHTHYWNNLEMDYWRAFGDSYFKAEMRERAVLFVALRSEGQVEPQVRLSRPSFLEPENRALLGRGKSIAESTQPSFWVCQGNLLAQARQERSIKEFLEERMESVRG
jgi:hypothetical protein